MPLGISSLNSPVPHDVKEGPWSACALESCSHSPSSGCAGPRSSIVLALASSSSCYSGAMCMCLCGWVWACWCVGVCVGVGERLGRVFCWLAARTANARASRAARTDGGEDRTVDQRRTQGAAENCPKNYRARALTRARVRTSSRKAAPELSLTSSSSLRSRSPEARISSSLAICTADSRGGAVRQRGASGRAGTHERSAHTEGKRDLFQLFAHQAHALEHRHVLPGGI